MTQSQTTRRYRSIRAYFRYINTFRGRFIVVFSFFAVGNILLATLPIFIGQLVAALSEKPLVSGHVYWLVAILIAISIGHDTIWRMGEILFRRLLNSKAYEFENIVFQAIISKPYPYFIDKFTGKISSYVASLGREFREFVNRVCYEYTDILIKLPIIIIIMFTVNVYTGVMFVVGVVIMVIAGKKLIGKTVEAERQLTDKSSNLDGYVIDVISNFVSVKAFRHARTELETVIAKRRGVVESSSRMLLWDIFFWGMMSIMVRWVIWPSTILLNVYLFLHGQMNLAQITTFISTLLIFSDFIWVVVWHISQFNVALGRIEESYRYLFGERDIVAEHLEGRYEVIDTHGVVSFDRSLVLHDLSFAYPDKPDRKILKDISLTIHKNEKIGIVGASGSGKTTLIKLLLGYYELSVGTLSLDDQPIDNRQLVDLIAYVPQDTPLFHRTIGENIAYGTRREVTSTEIEAAARRAHAHEFITQTTDGYGALVGERGIKLSMGQRQRVAIARAFLDAQPILLLDEATSALDSESEVLVQKALEDLWHNRTVIAIAHRLSTLRHMNRIIVMHEGRVVEEGTHEALLAKKGRYWRLWQHQSGGVLLDGENE